MKRLISVLLVTLILLSLCACGKTDNPQESTTDVPTVSTSPTENPNNTEDPTSSEPEVENTEPVIEPTEPEEVHTFHVLNTEVLAPKLAYASNANSVGGGCGGLEEEVETPIHIVALRVVADAEYTCSYDVRIPSLTDGQYYVAETTYSYLWNGGDYGDAVTEANLLDIVYVIEYTAETDKEIWLETCTGEKIINLSDVTYDKEVKTSGDVGMYECGMVEDEYGTKQYLIPIGSYSDYCNVGSASEDMDIGWFKFNLIQISCCENVPTDTEHIQEFFWHPENVSLEYDGFKYYEEKTTDDKAIYIPNSSKDNLRELHRRLIRMEITTELITKDASMFKEKSTMYLNFEDLRFCFDILTWQ